MSKIKTLAGETVLYGLGSIVPRFISFLLVAVHTDVFTNPESYGIITKLYAYASVVNIIYIFGMETTYFRFATKSGADESKIFSMAQTAVFIISTLLSASFIISSSSIAQAIGLVGQERYIIWFVAIMFIDAIVAIPFARLRLQKKPLQFALGKLINIGILVGLNVYFLYVIYDPDIGIDYVFMANMIANAFYLFFFIKTLFAWRFSYNKEMMGAMFSYAYPIMFTGVAGMVNEMFSRITLEKWLPVNFYPGKTSDYALGVFGACYKFSAIMNLAVQAFRYAAEPFFFSHASDSKSPELFARVNHYFIIVCSFIFLAVSINLDILKYFLRSEEYWEGLNIVPILLLAYLFLGVYYNLTVWFKLTDRTYYGTIITVGGAIVTIVLNYILIPIFGYYGSSIAAFGCYFSMTVVCYLIGQRYFPIPYRVISAFGYLIATTALVYAVNLVTFSSQLLASGFHLAVMIIFLLVVYGIERGELKNEVF